LPKNFTFLIHNPRLSIVMFPETYCFSRWGCCRHTQPATW